MYPQGCGGSSPFFGTSSFLLNNLVAWCPSWCPEISGLVSSWCPEILGLVSHPRNFLREISLGRNNHRHAASGREPVPVAKHREFGERTVLTGFPQPNKTE